jgi:peptidoglycan/xylan/chitin deacetylase (PgdA/CDA1 family)
MTMSTLGQFRSVVRRTFRKRKEGALILLYHRVTSLPIDPFHLAVSREHFAQHLNVLQASYPVLKLEDALRCAQGNRVPDRSVVITFDDGYNDLLHQALPLLKQYDMPATAFITSGYVGAKREPWWDELEKACLAKEALPATLDLQLGGRSFHWSRPDALKHPFLSRRDGSERSMYLPFAGGWRMQLFRTLHDMLYPLPANERDALLVEILDWADVAVESRYTHRMLSEDELRAVADDGTIEIGAHTVNHVSLASTSIDAQEKEISESKIVLERIAGRTVRAFAYPFGGSSDYTHETTVLVQESGFGCACSAFDGLIQQGTDPFELPRFEVHDWDGNTFADHLDDWWRGWRRPQ